MWTQTQSGHAGGQEQSPERSAAARDPRNPRQRRGRRGISRCSLSAKCNPSLLGLLWASHSSLQACLAVGSQVRAQRRWGGAPRGLQGRPVRGHGCHPRGCLGFTELRPSVALTLVPCSGEGDRGCMCGHCAGPWQEGPRSMQQVPTICSFAHGRLGLVTAGGQGPPGPHSVPPQGTGLMVL